MNSNPNSISAVTCEDGFVVDTATNTCANVNECDNGTPCGANADCKDNDGSFVCECHLGWNTGASGNGHFSLVIYAARDATGIDSSGLFQIVPPF